MEIVYGHQTETEEFHGKIYLGLGSRHNELAGDSF